ncbi:MAG: exonuclease SbcCD subunit D [Clostridia bacterium]|nr:exonuclease SbcCD subunit D [Clostridia bacterium]
MKLIHISDLHIGKRVNEFPMLEDQKYILTQILNIIDEEQPAAVLIAGDVYDKSVPSAEAVETFDDFLCRLAKRGLQVFVISGNHDSAERIAFGGRLMEKSGVHMSPVYSGTVTPITLEDEYGKAAFYMLPFVKPVDVRRFFEEEEIASYTDAIRCAVDHMNIDESIRNVIISHQFVTGAERSESEEISVGGTDNVDVSVYDAFDYVALGHIHGPQHVKRETVRYCGTPLKYSFSEEKHVKSVTIVELKEKGSVEIRTAELKPKHDMRSVKGSYEELTDRKNYEGTNTDDYLHITLTDEEDVPDAMRKLSLIYPNLMKMDYDNIRTKSAVQFGGAENVESKSETELLDELYAMQNGQPMSEVQKNFARDLFERIKEEML